jgi:hypothetical protein
MSILFNRFVYTACPDDHIIRVRVGGPPGMDFLGGSWSAHCSRICDASFLSSSSCPKVTIQPGFSAGWIGGGAKAVVFHICLFFRVALQRYSNIYHMWIYFCIVHICRSGSDSKWMTSRTRFQNNVCQCCPRFVTPVIAGRCLRRLVFA